MADGKKSFLLYCDLIQTVKKLNNDQAGVLFKTILEYVNDMNPEPDDLLIEIAFEPIKQQLKRDLKHWETIKSKRSEAGKLSAESKKAAKENQQNSTKSTSVKSVQQNSTKSTATDTVNVTVNVNDTVNVNEEQKKELVSALMIEFNFSEIRSPDKLRLLWQFANYLESGKGIDYFIQTFQSYKKWKEISGEKSHNFMGLIGTPAMNFENGGWDSDNWQYKIDNYKPQGKTNPVSRLDQAQRLYESTRKG